MSHHTSVAARAWRLIYCGVFVAIVSLGPAVLTGCLDPAFKGGVVGGVADASASVDVGTEVATQDAASWDTLNTDTAADIAPETDVTGPELPPPDVAMDTEADTPPPPEPWVWIPAPVLAGPGARYGHFAAYDSKRDRMLVGHGLNPYTSGAAYDEYADLWALDLKTWQWSLIEEGTAMPHSSSTDAAYDAEADRLWIAGDQMLYSVDLETLQWTTVAPIPSAPYSSATFVSVSSTEVRLLSTPGSNGEGVLSEHRLRLATGEWTTFAVPHPDGVRWHFDVSGAYLSGGYTGECASGGVWRLQEGAWSAVQTPTIAPRLNHVSAYTVTDHLVLFGGGGGCYCGASSCADNGLVVVDMALQQPVFIDGGTLAPEHVRSATMVHATASNELVLFGGAVNSDYAVDAVWRLTLP